MQCVVNYNIEGSIIRKKSNGEFMFSTTSLIHKGNNRGPKIEPWGTPASIEDQLKVRS